MFDVLAERSFDVDVVFWPGYRYHTLRYNELLHPIQVLQPRELIIDTEGFPDPKRELVKLALDKKGLIFDRFSYGEQILVGWPSVPALSMMLSRVRLRDRSPDRLGWPRAHNPQAEGVADYATGWRVTAVCGPAAAIASAG